jgi:hypothetical protein
MNNDNEDDDFDSEDYGIDTESLIEAMDEWIAEMHLSIASKETATVETIRDVIMKIDEQIMELGMKTPSSLEALALDSTKSHTQRALAARYFVEVINTKDKPITELSLSKLIHCNSVMVQIGFLEGLIENNNQEVIWALTSSPHAIVRDRACEFLASLPMGTIDDTPESATSSENSAQEILEDYHS